MKHRLQKLARKNLTKSIKQQKQAIDRGHKLKEEIRLQADEIRRLETALTARTPDCLVEENDKLRKMIEIAMGPRLSSETVASSSVPLLDLQPHTVRSLDPQPHAVWSLDATRNVSVAAQDAPITGFRPYDGDKDYLFSCCGGRKDKGRNTFIALVKTRLEEYVKSSKQAKENIRRE
jgi:hypothetical protein